MSHSLQESYWTNSKSVYNGLEIARVLNAAENYVLTCSHLRTTFVIQHKLHTHGLSARVSILHRVWLLLAATATATTVVAMLSFWLIISMFVYKMVCIGWSIRRFYYYCLLVCSWVRIGEDYTKWFIRNEKWRQSKYLQFSSRNPCQCM